MDQSVRTRAPGVAAADPQILVTAIGDSFKKLNPRLLIRNPVMFTVEVVAALVTLLFIRDVILGHGHYGFAFQIILWLWFTVLFANSRKPSRKAAARRRRRRSGAARRNPMPSCCALPTSRKQRARPGARCQPSR